VGGEGGGRAYRDDGEIVISKPQVTFFMEDGKRRANLVGVEGRLTLDGKELSTVTLEGDVVLLIDDLEMRTDTARYDHAPTASRAGRGHDPRQDARREGDGARSRRDAEAHAAARAGPHGA
jgi:hypothetical protein